MPKVLDLGNGVILVIAFLGPTLAWTRRRDLVGKVFFSHYEPRLRDNERWAIDGLPLRGGPVSA